MNDFPAVKTIAVDFDGVIHSYDKGWCGGEVYGSLMPHAKEAITKLKSRGFEIVVLTARDDFAPVVEWLHKHDLDLPITNIKPPAIAYVSKWAIRFTGNWLDIIEPEFTDKEMELSKKHEGSLPNLTDAEWGYIGGLIDGEGSITAGINGNGRLYMRIIITNQHIAVLEWIKEKFGGSIYSKKVIDNKHFPVYWWTTSGIRIRPILKKLLEMDMIKMKKKQAALAIEFLNNMRYNGRKRTQFSELSLQQLVEAISSLNRYGSCLFYPIIIDDRAIRFTNWFDIENYFV